MEGQQWTFVVEGDGWGSGENKERIINREASLPHHDQCQGKTKERRSSLEGSNLPFLSPSLFQPIQVINFTKHGCKFCAPDSATFIREGIKKTIFFRKKS